MSTHVSKLIRKELTINASVFRKAVNELEIVSRQQQTVGELGSLS